MGRIIRNIRKEGHKGKEGESGYTKQHLLSTTPSKKKKSKMKIGHFKLSFTNTIQNNSNKKNALFNLNFCLFLFFFLFRIIKNEADRGLRFVGGQSMSARNEILKLVMGVRILLLQEAGEIGVMI